MEKLSVRQANSADESAVLECVSLSYEKYVSRLGKKPYPMLMNYALLIEEGNVFVGELAGQIVGILVLKDFPDYILLDNVAVFPSYQGKGIGKSLIEFAENYAKQRCIMEIRLYTNIKMVENISIYKKLGYSETEIKWEDGYHRVFFQKPLSVQHDT